SSSMRSPTLSAMPLLCGSNGIVFDSARCCFGTQITETRVCSHLRHVRVLECQLKLLVAVALVIERLIERAPRFVTRSHLVAVVTLGTLKSCLEWPWLLRSCSHV